MAGKSSLLFSQQSYRAILLLGVFLISSQSLSIAQRKQASKVKQANAGQCIEGNCYQGQGTFLWDDGARYVGNWLKAKRSGKGSYTWPDNRSYEGYWKNDIAHGKGLMLWPSGDQYQGDWKRGKMDGIGIYRYANGSQYMGEFRDNKPHGKGILYDAKGNKIYEGFWLNGKAMKY